MCRHASGSVGVKTTGIYHACRVEEGEEEEVYVLHVHATMASDHYVHVLSPPRRYVAVEKILFQRIFVCSP